MQRKKVGLALGSGGVRGFAHVGVIKTLLKHNIPIDYIAGSSIGGFVACHYALFKDIEKLEEISFNHKKKKFYSLLDPAWSGGLVSGKKLKKLIEEWLDHKAFEDSQIPVKIVATNIIKGSVEIFDKGDLVPALMASMAIPTIFKPMEIDDKYYIDGGISNPVPDDLVKKMGADIVISVNLDDCNNATSFEETDLSVIGVTKRSLDLLRNYLAKNSVNDSDIVIEPATNLKGWSGWKDYFSKDGGVKIVEAGETAAEKVIPEIKKLLDK